MSIIGTILVGFIVGLIARAVKGEPRSSEVTAKKDSAHHPFAAG